ncbi:hypothetical protein PBAL39_09081 [Pedobacter sp. BAL39]|uniref:hypothetical protein n=1 Tax=Pedobacter sp. BAL39 TaxID=391596 RepID=UPI00015598DB|nr:hypothetical protein [Pedobacter sp. BAL39]EDM37284.1 hypothetical protein PBAL39_09081 [Pedobacter sp. BAL39]
MKTSNKLLITFAFLAFLVPLSITAYTAKTGYVSVDEDKARNESKNHFDSATSGMTSVAINRPFSKLELKDGMMKSWTFIFIKDQHTGIKISDGLKDSISADVDADGTLQISWKGKQPKSDYDIYEVFVYGPVVSGISVKKVNRVGLEMTADTLNLSMRDVVSAELEGAFDVGRLKIDAKGVRDLAIRRNRMETLSLDLEATSLRSSLQSCGFQQIHASNESSVVFGLYDRDNHKNVVDRLQIVTEGKVSLSIDEEIDLHQISGRLSDETTVSMPVLYLKKLMH